jgi:hypothetical protein
VSDTQIREMHYKWHNARKLMHRGMAAKNSMPPHDLHMLVTDFLLSDAVDDRDFSAVTRVLNSSHEIPLTFDGLYVAFGKALRNLRKHGDANDSSIAGELFKCFIRVRNLTDKVKKEVMDGIVDMTFKCAQPDAFFKVMVTDTLIAAALSCDQCTEIALFATDGFCHQELLAAIVRASVFVSKISVENFIACVSDLGCEALAKEAVLQEYCRLQGPRLPFRNERAYKMQLLDHWMALHTQKSKSTH